MLTYTFRSFIALPPYYTSTLALPPYQTRTISTRVWLALVLGFGRLALVSLSLITRQRRFVSSSIIFGGLKTLIDDFSALGSFSANRA